MSSQYVAIYKIKNLHWNKDLSYYAVGQGAPKPEKNFSSTEFNDPALTTKLVSKLKKDIEGEAILLIAWQSFSSRTTTSGSFAPTFPCTGFAQDCGKFFF